MADLAQSRDFERRRLFDHAFAGLRRHDVREAARDYESVGSAPMVRLLFAAAWEPRRDAQARSGQPPEIAAVGS